MATERELPAAAGGASMRDDRILWSSRLLAAVVVPVLFLAFAILYLDPDSSGQRFAWEIHPRMSAMFIGAGYLGGSYLFVHVIFEGQWHRVAAGFPAVTAFTVSMLVVTILHWDRFDLQHIPFQLWLFLYVLTPILVPLVWLRNRGTDPGTPEPDDVLVPAVARWALGLLGVGLLGLALLAFVGPALVAPLWPWRLTPLMTRVLAGWFALLGVGGIVIARDTRWSAWRVGLQSIALWHALVLLAAVLNPGDFSTLANWYLASVVLVLAGMAILYAVMTARQARADVR